MALFDALSFRPFALVWAGQTVSRLGDGLHTVAVAWWVLEETGSAAAMGGVLVASVVPELLFTLLGGVAVDRVSRLRVMLASDLLRGAVVGLTAILAWAGLLALWHLVVLGAVFGLARAFFFPAYTAVVPDLLPPEVLPSANALRSISFRVAGVAGPAAGGAIVAAGGTAGAFGLDAVSFLVAGACVLGAGRSPALRRPTPSAGGMLGDLRDGFATVLGSPWLWISIAIAGVSNIAVAGPLVAALPLLVKDELGAGARTYGLLNSLAAVGAVGAAAWLGRRRRLRRRGWLMYGAWVVLALATAAIGLPVGVGGVAAAMLVQGAAGAVLGLAWTSTLQEPAIVAPERLGRVASIDALGSYGLLPVGFALAGVAADRVGAPLVFVLGGTLGAAVIGLGLLHPEVRGLD